MLPKADFDLFYLLSSHKVTIKCLKIFFKQLSQALSYCHQKSVAHNDIKLANLFVVRKENKMILADFGFARKQEAVLPENAALD